MVRFGKWQIDFHRPGAGDPEINIDQSKNLLEVERGNDLLAALCIAYAFDKALCQPIVTIIGYQEKEHMDDDDDSFDSLEPEGSGRAVAPNDPPAYPALPAPEEEEEPFEPAGYLGYEEDPENPEVAGYLENEPYTDNDGYNDGYDNYEEPAGYLEDQAYNDDPNNAGYIENDGYDQSGSDVVGYIEQERFSDEH
jgi:hypothetical protein